MAFYVGCYLIDQDALEPLHTGAWFMPDAPTQHMAETSNVEELQVLPTDMDSIPTQIQFGACAWTDDDGSALSDGFTSMFYQTGSFYTRSFSGTDLFTEFYIGQVGFTEFYSPISSFYTISFSPVDFFTEFYTAPDSFTEFYSPVSSFYIQNFAPVDFFYSAAEEDC